MGQSAEEDQEEIRALIEKYEKLEIKGDEINEAKLCSSYLNTLDGIKRTLKMIIKDLKEVMA